MTVAPSITLSLAALSVVTLPSRLVESTIALSVVLAALNNLWPLVGSVVNPGDVIGLIEAMKLFNEIRSTKSGRVRRIAAENGQLVRAHQLLMELDPA